MRDSRSYQQVRTGMGVIQFKSVLYINIKLVKQQVPKHLLLLHEYTAVEYM